MTLIKSISGIRGTVGGAAGREPDAPRRREIHHRIRTSDRRAESRQKTYHSRRPRRPYFGRNGLRTSSKGTLLACGADVDQRRALHHAGHRDGRHRQAGRRRHHHHRVAQPASVERPEAAQLRRRIPHRRRGQARAGDGRGGGLRVPRRGRHRACAFARTVQPDAYRAGAGASARGRRGGPQTPLQGGRGRREFRGRHRYARTPAAAGVRSRGAELRPDGRIRPQPRTAARKPDRNRGDDPPRESRSGHRRRSRRGPAGAGQRGRLDVRRGVYAGCRGRLYSVEESGRRHRFEPLLVAGAARRYPNGTAANTPRRPSAR